MPRVRILVPAALLAALLAACGGGSSSTGSNPPPPTVGAVSGVVRRTGTNAPVSGATVQIGAVQGTSAADGSYTLADVPIGPDTLVVSATGYDAYTALLTVAAAGTTKDVVLVPTTVFLADTAALYIPLGVTSVRAVMVYLAAFDTRSVATGLTDTSETGIAMQVFRSAANAMLVQHGVALVGIARISLGTEAEMEAAILSELSALAGASHHPEVANVPLFPVGWSGGGSPVYNFVHRQPQRCLAFFTWIGSLHGYIPLLPAAQQVPGAILLAEGDSLVDSTTIRNWYNDNRAQGALWSLGIEPNAIHNPPDGLVLGTMFQWMRDILALRLPAGSSSLVPLVADSGWLGDPASFTVAPYAQFAGDTLTAAWFPTQASAVAWQSLVSPVPAQ